MASGALHQHRLTLIVAATHAEMGIGLRGSLPWPLLQKEMAYFAKVTRRAPPESINAVVMGRRTWDSIPLRFRPLRDRLNVVLTRTPGSLGESSLTHGREEGPFPMASLDDALAFLHNRDAPDGTAPPSRQGANNTQRVLDRIFVIGGAEVYRAALMSALSDRILLTRVKTHFDCDTQFPLHLGRSDPEAEDVDVVAGTWTQMSSADLDRWVGGGAPHGPISEVGVEWEAEMWEKRGSEQASGTNAS